MLWIIGFLTVVLVLDSLFLILLVLVQLPKKEAGLGQAFGSSTTDALFGAGSGNALTKMTKYSTGIFFTLTFVIYLMYNHEARSRSGAFATKIQQAGKDVEIPKPPTAATNTLVTKTDTNAPAQTNINVRQLLTTPQSAPSTAPAEEAVPKPPPATAK
jgi:preprotein translocase subunit SecG